MFRTIVCIILLGSLSTHAAAAPGPRANPRLLDVESQAGTGGAAGAPSALPDPGGAERRFGVLGVESRRGTAVPGIGTGVTGIGTGVTGRGTRSSGYGLGHRGTGARWDDVTGWASLKRWWGELVARLEGPLRR